MDIRNRLLLVLMALSLMLGYDILVNSRHVVATFFDSLVRPSPAPTLGWGIGEDAPFVRKEGSLAQEAAGVRRVVLRATGDISIGSGTSQEVRLDYEVRTYGMSSRHVREYHDQVDVVARRDGEVLEIALVTPGPHRDVEGTRGRFILTVPQGLAIEIDSGSGDVDLHGVAAELLIRQRRGSVRVTDHRGPVEVDIAGGSVWLNRIQGDVVIRHTDGRTEATLVDGGIDFTGGRSSVTVDRASGRVKIQLEQGVAALYGVAGPAEIDAHMARVTIVENEGSVAVRGRLSPVHVVRARGSIEVTSESANVDLELPAEGRWQVDVQARPGRILPSPTVAAALGQARPGDRLTAALGQGSDERSVAVRISRGEVRLDLI